MQLDDVAIIASTRLALAVSLSSRVFSAGHNKAVTVRSGLVVIMLRAEVLHQPEREGCHASKARRTAIVGRRDYIINDLL
jgi:hypothetical protein